VIAGNNLLTGEGEGGGGRGAELYYCEKAWSSINYSKLSFYNTGLKGPKHEIIGFRAFMQSEPECTLKTKCQSSSLNHQNLDFLAY
jgi:hypothetical protein